MNGSGAADPNGEFGVKIDRSGTVSYSPFAETPERGVPGGGYGRSVVRVVA